MMHKFWPKNERSELMLFIVHIKSKTNTVSFIIA